MKSPTDEKRESFQFECPIPVVSFVRLVVSSLSHSLSIPLSTTRTKIHVLPEGIECLTFCLPLSQPKQIFPKSKQCSNTFKFTAEFAFSFLSLSWTENSPVFYSHFGTLTFWHISKTRVFAQSALLHYSYQKNGVLVFVQYNQIFTFLSLSLSLPLTFTVLFCREFFQAVRVNVERSAPVLH